MSQQFDIVGNLLLKVDNAEAGVNKLRNSLSKLKIPSNIDSDLKKSFSNLDGLFSKYKTQLQNGFKTKSDVSGFTKTAKDISAEYDRITKKINQLNNTNVSFNIKNDSIIAAEKHLNKLLETKEKLSKNTKSSIEKELTAVTKAGSRSTNVKDISSQLSTALDTGNMQKAVELATQLKSKMVDLKSAQTNWIKAGNTTSLVDTLNKIINECQKGATSFDNLEKETKEAAQVLATLQTGDLEKINQVLSEMSGDWDKSNSAMKAASGEMEAYASATQSAAQQLKDLQQSTQYFFSLRNMINLFKRGIREAVDTIKDLDKAMTETAVVTNFSVGDMWAKLPEYTANANALGATVQDMYESTTLYYQQGLNTQQAMGIATETMKMARIAGMGAAEATDMMTAALRGFNMEINETSAEHINDVYSNLAAKTASNTEELGTAMQRTASIAHSAGMSFEGTAAFLAQAIETTREPAENLGTAMKTIVARFQELKKNPLEIAEVEGEEVSYNKIDAALKTIGVDLKDANGQFRDLDKVFLDISQRWDSLSQTQQRYIATTAAGSRQQSRFIAMMSDYNRTMELMGYANNSAGASTTQFNKTLDSLEAKINKFQNAWKQFLMGIMNDSWTKKVVDAGTSILNIVNKIIDALSLGGKLKGVKSILSTLTAFTALKTAGRGVNALIGGLGGMVDPTSNFRGGAQAGFIGKNSAQAINQPIVQELQNIRSLIATKINDNTLGKTKAAVGPYDDYNEFKNARLEIADMKGQGTVGNLIKQLSGLSVNNQNLLMNSNAGTFRAATNAIIDAYGIKNRKEIKKGERWLDNERKSARITAEEYYAALQDPGLLKDAMKQAGINEHNPAYEYINGLDEAATQMRTDAKEKAKKALTQYGGTVTEEDYARLEKAFESDKARKYFANKALEAQGNKPIEKVDFSTSKWGQTLDSLGKMGSGISQAGMGIQAFGNILTSSANPALQMFGGALTSLGSLISGLGMGISGVASGFTALASSSAMETAASWLVTAAKGPEAASSAAVAAAASALTGGLLILVAAIAAVAFAIKKHNENIKKAAEEVTTKYKDKSSENQSNLSNLRQWKSELAILSKGVDENGYNISLDTSDYEHYLEIVDGIAKINPEIVQGYNAQGHAIIDNNNALEKTLALEEQHSRDILRNYTSTDSLTKLLKARNLERSRVGGGGGSGRAYVEPIEWELKPRTNMRREMSKIGRELQKNKNLIDLSELDINIDDLASGSEAEFRKVLSNYNLFERLVSESIDRAGDEWGDKSREAIEKSLASFEDYGSELDELVEPVYEALSASASQTSGFKEMADNLKTPFQNALKELATNGEFADGKEIDKAAKNMATKFAGYSETYLDAMEQVDAANKQFALDFNKQEYDAHTEEAINELEALKSTLEDTPEGHAISEWIDSEIHKIQNHLSTGTKSIEEAWDTISDKIAVAESTLDSFSKATEKDFYSAADDMQKIFETVMDEDAYHTVGLGDNTFWTGAESLLGADNIMNKTKNQVLDMIKSIEPFLKEGPEGVQNFANKVAELSPELEKIEGVAMTSDGWFKSIDENANPEAWAQIAEKLQISEELLTSMINKSRQFRQWDFSDMESIREAYSIDESVIHGTKKANVTTTALGGEETTVKADTLYITDTELRSRMGSDYYQKSERENKVEQLKLQGIEVLPEHLKDLSAKMMKTEMGIADWQAAIKTFGDTGVFDKSEIYEAAKTLAKSEQGKEFDETAFKEEFNEGWKTWLESYENPTLEPISTIASDVAAIASKIVGESSVDKKEKDKKEESKTEDATTEQTAEKVANSILKAEEKNKNLRGSDELTWKDRVPGWVASVIESAKNNEPTEDPKVVAKETASETTSTFWSKIGDLINTSANERAGYDTESTTEQTQTNENLTSSSTALTEAASQLTTGIEPLAAAGEGLTTAAANLTNAAAVLATVGQGSNTQQSTQGGTSTTPQPAQSSVSGAIVVDNTAALQSLEDVKTKAEETKSVIETGATFNVEVSDSGLKNAADKVKTINDGAGSKNISVTATASDPTQVNTLQAAVEKFSTLKDHKVKLTTSLAGATVKSINDVMKAIDAFHKKTSHTVRLTTINDKKATGSHNHGYVSPPSFGSAAGGYGQVGPKGRGGLTLTGELGYEIAWIPSENRSMILGANGPQMVNLPGDAVIWTHEQSKKILQQKSIPAGSHATTGKTSGGWDFTGYSGGGGGKTNATSKKVEKAAKNVTKSAKDAADAVKGVSVWWENIARKTEASQRKQDNNQKEFEKYLKEMRATLHMTGEDMSQGGGGGDDYIKSIGETLGYYEAQLEKVTKELDNLANGKIPSSAKERKSKYGEEGYENLAKVSYKKGKKSKEEFVNLADYIKEEAGTFVIDQKALDAISSKEKRQAVKDAADKEINDRLSKKYKAEDEIQKAQEAIDKMGEELYETFFKWETELTKIWNITQKIEQTEARISQAKGYSDLLESQLSTGMATAGKEFAAQSLSAFRASLQQQSKQINLSFEALNQKKIDLSKLLSLDDEKKTLENVQKKIVEGIDDQSQIAKLQEELANKQAVVSGLEEKIAKGDAAIASIDADITETEPKTKKGKKKNKKKAQKKLNKLNIQKEETIKQKGEYEAQKAEAVKEYEAAKAAYDEAKSNTINDTERLGYEEYAKQLENNIAMQARAWDFMSANQMADGTLDVQFDSDAFDKAKEEGTITEEQGKQIQDYIKSITEGSKELSQQYADTTSLINDMYGSLDSLQDAWAGYAEELWQISDEQQRKEVDNLKKLSDSLSDTFKSLIDDVKRKLDQRRKQEDNAKTEQDISRKQQRLAALQADTSGGHQVEIAQLQQEIANDQQNYQRSLEDQLLDSLQQQADLAAQQRERQIALQEAMINEINNAALVNEWMNNPEEYKDKIYQAFCDANDYDKKPEALQAQLDEKFNTLFNGLLTNQDEQQIVTNEIKSLEGKVTEIKDELSQVVALQNAISQLSAAASQLSVTNSTAQAVTKPTGLAQSQTTSAMIATATQQPVNQQKSTPTANTAGDAYKAAIDAAHKKKTVSKDTFIDAVNKGKAAGYGVDQVARDLAEGDGKGGVTWEEVVKAAKKASYTKAQVSKWSKDKYLVAAVKKWSKFASGGLADYTGPAWLDGTPSKPELVLNSTDTKNFLALRDILSSAMNSMNTVSNSYGGDTLYEININVDKIEKDYDVDRVVEKVKKEITKGAGYRNVTQVRNLR